MNRSNALLRNTVRRALQGLAIVVVGLAGSIAQGYTPESPVVRAMVERGLRYVGKATPARLGEKCLRGLCHLKYYKLIERPDEGKNHPTVKDALAACKDANLTHSITDTAGGTGNYSLGIALMFLCEVDPVANRQLIEKYTAELLKRQKPHGGWGYPGESTGDTSQTQYAVLGMWMAQKVAKVDVPLKAQEACAGWLMRTQAPDGGWGYQGTDPGSYTRIAQQGVTLSLSAAGCGSLYMSADLLQVTDSAASKKERPGPFKEIESPGEKLPDKKGPLTKTLDPGTINQYLKTGDGWFQRHYNIEASNWQHYYMYALERYESFKDLADGKWTDEPHWYNQGVEYLQKTQAPDGYWAGQDNASVATCFAMLFLMRSTQRAIGGVSDLGPGEQKGGYGLPPDVANLQERDGKIVDANLQGSIDQVLDLLKSGDSPETLRMLEQAQSIKLDGDVARRESQIDALRKVVSAGEPNSRVLAVKTIGKVRGLANVPTLLFALTDPHIPVVIEADRALRFVSRKIDGVGLPEKPTSEDVKAAREAWRAWYLSVKPDAELLD